MNRQFRRAQEKQDKRQEREKTKRREERRAKVRQMRQARREKGKADKRQPAQDESEAQRPARKGRVPGRFSGVLAAVTVFFITLQSAAPAQPEEGLGASLIGAGFYLMLGYFATLWFMRRGAGRAPVLSVVGGTLLAASVTAAQLIQEQPLDPLELALVIPALALGAFLGRLVFVASPR